YAFTVVNGGYEDIGRNAQVWTPISQSVMVDRIQGGDGTFYGVDIGPSGNQVYWTTNLAWRQDAAPTWRTPLATIGATLVTGTGAKATGPVEKDPGGGLPWPR